MDVSRFRVGDWVLAGAGVAMLVLGLAIPWVSVELGGVDLGGARNAFDYPLTGGLAWLLVVAAGVVTFMRAAGLLQAEQLPITRATVIATAVSVVLMLVRFALGAGDDSRAELGRGPGMIVALVVAGGALAGAVANLRAEGDRLGDLLKATSWTRERSTPPTGSAPAEREPPVQPGR